MKKSELNPNIHFSEGNIKSKCTDDVMFLTWSLPCKVTCPYGTEECKKRCFAQKNEHFKNVRDSRYRNLEETKKATFVKDIIDYLEFQLKRKKSLDKRIFVRIHTSGDFYNIEYLKKWIEITDYFKDNAKILFQAYTKSMPILRQSKREIDDINIHFVWSIWCDTPKEYTDEAIYMNMQTFMALPKSEILKATNKGLFLCNGNCGNCKECYTGKSKSIVIPYH